MEPDNWSIRFEKEKTMRIINKEHFESEVSYCREFVPIINGEATKREGWMSFDCGRNGKMFLKMPEQRKNAEYCLSHPDKYEDRGAVKTKHVYRIATEIACDCGTHIFLDRFTNECPRCGKLYNSYGQELEPYEKWAGEWNEGLEDASDLSQAVL